MSDLLAATALLVVCLLFLRGRGSRPRLGLGDRDPRGADGALADPVARLQDRHTGRLGDVRRVAVHQGLVDRRVEGLALPAELLEAQLPRDGFERRGDGLEAADEFTVLTGAADVVEDGQQLGQEVRYGDLLDRDAV